MLKCLLTGLGIDHPSLSCVRGPKRHTRRIPIRVASTSTPFYPILAPMLTRLLPLLLLVTALVGQQVTIENLTPNHFSGWKRVNIDVMPDHDEGIVDGVQYVLGRVTGDGTRALDVKVTLAGFETKTIELSDAVKAPFTVGTLPASPVTFFGGPVTIGGQPMSFVGLKNDGAGISSHLRARFGRTMHADLWMTWYPDQKAWASGELLLTMSNPAVTDMTEVVTDLEMKFGDALTVVPGLPISHKVIVGSASFANGQARLLPVTFVWLRHMAAAGDWASAGAVANMGISGIGIAELFHGGQRPYSSSNSDPNAWARDFYSESIRRLHTWEVGTAGPAKASTVTGAQEDQVFQRGEAMLPGGPGGAEIVTYLSACKYANRPCHFLEVDGSIVDGANHLNPRLLYWDGRIHWHTGVSPERMGKTEGLNLSDSHGWAGPDVEHWLISTLAIGHRYTGSPALAALLTHQAHIYMLQWTHNPAWSTSSIYASRAVGYEGIGCVSLFRELEDRALANRVRAHYRTRWDAIIKPRLANLPGNIWDIRSDVRMGFVNANGDGLAIPGWMPWQQSIGAYGLDMVGDFFDIPAARDAALLAAKTCVAQNWIKIPGGSRYRGISNQPFNNGLPMTPEFYLSGEPFGEVIWTWGAGWFETTWDVPSVWMVVQAEPGNQRARDIWRQVWSDTGGGGPWFPPGSEWR